MKTKKTNTKRLLNVTEVKGRRVTAFRLSSQEYVSDVIREGTWKHPKHGWALKVTPERMRQWADTFKTMKKDGIEIPVVKDHVVLSDTTIGYVSDMFLDGDWLRMRFQPTTDASAEDVERVKFMSIGLEKQFRSGTGKNYGEAIDHVSLTPTPVVTGQVGSKIAASRGGRRRVPVMYELANTDSSKEKTVADKKGEVPVIDWKAIGAALEIESELTPENAEALILEKVTVMTTAMKKLKQEVEELKNQKPEDKPKDGDQEPDQMDPDVKEERTDVVAEEAQRVAASLGLAPAVTKELVDSLTESTYLLSRQDKPNDKGRRPIRAMSILGVLAKIDPGKIVKPGGKTTVQGYNMSRNAGEGNPDPEPSAADLEKRAKSAYGVK